MKVHFELKTLKKKISPNIHHAKSGLSSFLEKKNCVGKSENQCCSECAVQVWEFLRSDDIFEILYLS